MSLNPILNPKQGTQLAQPQMLKEVTVELFPAGTPEAKLPFGVQRQLKEGYDLVKKIRITAGLAGDCASKVQQFAHNHPLFEKALERQNKLKRQASKLEEELKAITEKALEGTLKDPKPALTKRIKEEEERLNKRISKVQTMQKAVHASIPALPATHKENPVFVEEDTYEPPYTCIEDEEANPCLYESPYMFIKEDHEENPYLAPQPQLHTYQYGNLMNLPVQSPSKSPKPLYASVANENAYDVPLLPNQPVYASGAANNDYDSPYGPAFYDFPMAGNKYTSVQPNLAPNTLDDTYFVVPTFKEPHKIDFLKDES